MQVGSIGANVPTLGEEAELVAQTFSLAVTIIEIRMFNLALNPLFCQTCVIGCFSFSNQLINNKIQIKWQ
mgnify:CR=1 FL=1